MHGMWVVVVFLKRTEALALVFLKLDHLWNPGISESKGMVKFHTQPSTDSQYKNVNNPINRHKKCINKSMKPEELGTEGGS